MPKGIGYGPKITNLSRNQAKPLQRVRQSKPIVRSSKPLSKSLSKNLGKSLPGRRSKSINKANGNNDYINRRSQENL
jgi:hypothetical protein